ncbi:Rieske (2Fe-2S) protein [Burkholderia cepacia]|uniref:Rieske (2Fe-2S) protein n=1 Tax=Burkholderia cepacia TaxID=292 RepID=UPI003B52F7BC
MTRHFVCNRQDIAENGMSAFTVGEGTRVLLLRVEDHIYACDSVCPHQEVGLEEGLFDGEVLTCHQHMWQWKIATGEPVGAAECPLRVYRVDVEGDAIYVDPVDDS